MAYPPKAHCPQGHAYNPENTYVSPSGERHCRACIKAREAAIKACNAAKRLTPTQRFWPKVNKAAGQGPNGDCWEWTAHRMERGYGNFGVAGKIVKAHRFSYELAHGPIQNKALSVLHSCDNPPCVNPAHLRLGTHQENMQDMTDKGRHVSAEAKKMYCPQGHPLFGDNMHVRPDNGKRVCLACRRAADRIKKRNKKAIAEGRPSDVIDWRLAPPVIKG